MRTSIRTHCLTLLIVSQKYSLMAEVKASESDALVPDYESEDTRKGIWIIDTKPSATFSWPPNNPT